jgi:hypothetical protein
VAEALTRTAPEDTDGADGAPAARPAPHAGRFGFLLGVLIALGVAGLGVGVLFLTGDSADSTDTSWSSWQPGRSDVTDGAQEIAEHVAPRYKQTSGEQLVAVTGGPLEIQGLKLHIAEQAPVSQGGQIQVAQGTGAMYSLCGLGTNCAIPTGAPSSARHLLLRREALELALYSFHYLKGLDDVVVFLPPRKGEAASQAVHFARADVAAQLDRPLRASLSVDAPTPKQVRTAPDSSLVQRLTDDHLNCFSYTQQQTTEVFLVLEPLPATGCASATASTSGSATTTP